MSRLNKRMKEALKNVGQDKAYSVEDALQAVSQWPKLKFDESVELHVHLNLDPKASDQSVRGSVILPHGTGKKIKIAVVCKGEMEQQAKDAGADIVGAQELIEKIAKGFLDFDVVIAAPDMMRDLSKLGKILGPRGLMPTPKAGTVTTNIEKAIQDVKAGKVEFKADKQSGIHIGVGKRSFSTEQLKENIQHLIDAVHQAKPSSVKGNLVKSLFLSTTMGPGVRIAQ